MSRNLSGSSTITGPWGQSTVFSPGATTFDVNTGSRTSLYSEERIKVVRRFYTGLSFFQSSLFATILEDTAIQLRILGECNNELRIIKTYSDWQRLINNKHGVVLPPADDVEGIDEHNLLCDKLKINKLDSDRKQISDAVLKTYGDLCQDRHFKSLEDTVREIREKESYRNTMIAEEVKNKSKLRELLKQLRIQRNHMKASLYDADVKIYDLQTKLEDSSLVSETRTRYVKNWQNARTEQHIQTILNKQQVYTNGIEYFKRRTDNEHRVHAEIQTIININISETLEKVTAWMNKYDTDIESIDLRIQLKKNEYYDMFNKRERMEELIAKREKLMTDWITFKDEREKARLYREKMTNSAITVQAWWRGLLVRLKLGPYKEKKKKPEPKKKY